MLRLLLRAAVLFAAGEDPAPDRSAFCFMGSDTLLTCCHAAQGNFVDGFCDWPQSQRPALYAVCCVAPIFADDSEAYAYDTAGRAALKD